MDYDGSLREEAAMRSSVFASPNTRRLILILFLMVVGGSGSLCFCQQRVVKRHAIAVSTQEFTLQRNGYNFSLQRLPLAAKYPPISIPREWLVPPGNPEEEEGSSPVDPFNYDRHVTSFPIGDGEIGLRISSFDAMTEGSMAAAAGKDVFLIYDPKLGKLRAGGFDLGITKERYRVDGCFRAQAAHLLIADVNQDGLVDIGVVKEEIWCPEIGEDEDDVSEAQAAEHKKLPSELTNIVEIHLYQQHVAAWYVYTPQGWKLDPEQTGLPETFFELPLVGIVLSPVDFVGEVIWRSLDPKSWMDRPLYVPTYREKLIAQEPLPSKNSRRRLKFETSQTR